MTVQEQIVSIAQRYGLDPALPLAVARRESNFNPGIVSSKGAIGVFQLMPATARELGVNPYNLAQNIEGGIRYLQQMLGAFGGNLQKALAAYNWGPGNLAEAIQRYGQRWAAYLPQETKKYLRDVLALLGSAFPPAGSPGSEASSPGDSAEGVSLALLGLAGILFLVLILD